VKVGNLIKITLSGYDIIGIVTKVEGPNKSKTWFTTSRGGVHWTHENNLEILSESR